MEKWEPQAAAALVGVAGYSLWQAWQGTAPTLAELRTAAPGDDTMRQRLMDADLTVGSLAAIIGVTTSVLTKDLTAVLVMLAMFSTLTIWHHQVLAAPSR